MHRAAALVVLPLAVFSAPVAGQSCTPGWSDAFPSGDLTGTVCALANFDPDGPGPAPTSLIAAGDFTLAGGLPVGRIAKWDGRHWLPLGTGLGGANSTVYGATVFDDDDAGPLPPALYVCGNFTTAGGVAASCIARWNGTSWSSPGQITGGSIVRCMAVYDDDGPGPHPPALYVGGTFTSVSGTPVHHLAKWDGTSWADVGGGVTASSPTINAMTVFDDDGPGPHLPVLVIGGNFDHAGALAVDCLAAWNGTSWSSLQFVNGPVTALAVFDEDGDDPGPAKLFAGARPSGVVVRRLDGATWTTIGSTVSNTVLNVLTVFDEDGPGPNPPVLYAGGGFTNFGGVSGLKGIARWDGSAWSAAGSGVGVTQGTLVTCAMLPSDGAGGANRLCVGGWFQTAGPVGVNGIAAWDGSAWHPFGNAIGGTVNALAEYDPDGPGPSPSSLLIGGAFANAGDTAANGIVRWNGASFVPLGTGIAGGLFSTAVNAIVVFDEDGAGPNPPSVFVGGDFTLAGGGPANRVAKWDGSTWSPVGAGFDSVVQALAVFDDGSGPRLYAGGRFHFSGLSSANYLAKWNGTTWVEIPSQLNARVRSLAVFDDDGPGPIPPALYVGHESNNFPAYLGRWSGSSWSTVGSGLNGPAYALSILDPDGPGGSPPMLYVGGGFTIAGGIVAKHLATWDGSSWGPVGFGFQNGVNADVFAVAGIDDNSSGPDPWSCFAGGQFTAAGPTNAGAVARFDGGDWFSLNGGVTDAQQAIVSALLPFDDDGAGPAAAAMYVGGHFLSAGGVSSGNLARWGCPTPPPCYANCDASTTAPVLNVLDFACFLNRYAAGDPYANCDGSTTTPVLNVLDFACFLNRYAAGCP